MTRAPKVKSSPPQLLKSRILSPEKIQRKRMMPQLLRRSRVRIWLELISFRVDVKTRVKHCLPGRSTHWYIPTRRICTLTVQTTWYWSWSTGRPTTTHSRLVDGRMNAFTTCATRQHKRESSLSVTSEELECAAGVRGRRWGVYIF
eukprot:1366338-Amorphochlora_amoeboformis.AAC.1